MCIFMVKDITDVMTSWPARAETGRGCRTWCCAELQQISSARQNISIMNWRVLQTVMFIGCATGRFSGCQVSLPAYGVGKKGQWNVVSEVAKKTQDPQFFEQLSEWQLVTMTVGNNELVTMTVSNNDVSPWVYLLCVQNGTPEYARLKTQDSKRKTQYARRNMQDSKR